MVENTLLEESKNNVTVLELKLQKSSDSITYIDVPVENETLRVSIGVQVLVPVNKDGVRHWVLLLNKNRLANDDFSRRHAVLGPIGGGAGWKEGEKTKSLVKNTFELDDSHFSNKPEDTLDCRISQIPLESVGKIINFVIDSECIDFKEQIIKEMHEEVCEEMEELAHYAEGAIKADNYNGEMPKYNEYVSLGPYIDPIKVSQRQTRKEDTSEAKEKSLRIQYRFILEPDPQLSDYFIKNSITYKEAVECGHIDTPFMLFSDDDMQKMILTVENSSSEREAIVPGIVLGKKHDGLPICVSGLVKIFEDQIQNEDVD